MVHTFSEPRAIHNGWMRALMAGCCFVGVALAVANEHRSVPTGLVLPGKKWEASWTGSQTLRHSGLATLRKGFGASGEAALLHEGKNWDGTVAWQLLPSLADRIPGFTVGVESVGNRAGRRSAYLAATMEFNQYGQYNADSPAQVTIGGGSGRLAGMFLGFHLPVTNHFALQAEYDSNSVGAGVEFRLPNRLAFQWFFRQNSTDLSLKVRF